MKKLLAGLAVLGLLAVASPAEAKLDPCIQAGTVNPCAIDHLFQLESAKIHMTNVSGTLTAHAVWGDKPNGMYSLEILPNGTSTGSCFVSNKSPSTTTQPVGDWSCSVANASGEYTAIFEVWARGPVSGVLSLDVS